jgi:formylglycine-generating enzyme required for sulfatase activity
MSGDRARRLAQLRQAHESGILDEDTYQAAVAALGVEATTQATVDGSGAVAQDESVAAGAYGVAVGGDVRGNVYVGPPTSDPAEALAIYRRVLASTCRYLPMRGVDVGVSDPTGKQQRLDLAQVYVALDTRTQVPLAEEEKKQREDRLIPGGDREARPLGVVEATVGNRHLVILGDPGSGKSTFLSNLALCLVVHHLEPQANWLDHLSGWPEDEAGALPILVVLRDFARRLPEEIGRPDPCHLWDFVVARLEAQNMGFAAEPLHQALEGGRAVVLLDGLDEIPTGTQRTFVRDSVAAFTARYPGSRVVVTCRTLAYQDPAWRLAGLPDFELAPFDAEKVDHFIGAWYEELARLGTVKTEDATGLAKRLRDAVRRPDLWRLAPNPLLLTVMALVHTHKGRLPDTRALLYEDTVDILLWRWEQIKAGGEEQAPHLRQLLLDAGRTDVDLKRTLWQLAFEAHGESGAGDGGDAEALADISEFRLQKALAGLHPEGSRDWAHRVIDAIKSRAGVLLERAPEVYTFPHRTFQEYMAGAHLSAQADFARRAARLVEEGAFWREVVLLAVGRLVYLAGDTDKPLALAGELCPAKVPDDGPAWRKAWLAGEVLAEVGLNRVNESALGRDLVARVRHRLADLLRLGQLSPVERASAGRALARLGDPRPGVGMDSGTGLPDVAWCEVPPGPFLMGSTDGDEMAYDDEKPRHPADLAGFRISRFPVTHVQYAAFSEAGGYQERRYWTKAGWEWKEQGEESGPYDFGEPFNLPNHPVVGVSWYEAVAFCRWLTEQLRRSGALGDGEQITLPTEPQWEKAARGTDGRIYPWGDDLDSDRANYHETSIGTTSAVGCFPGGASPYGVEDLSGNVWEWTRSLWGKDWGKPDFGYPYDPADGRENLEAGNDALRVLRGGSFPSGAWLVRCASRPGHLPLSRGGNLGFRVIVASPVHL